MTRRILLFALLSLLVLSGCADSHTGLLKETVAAMSDAAGALEPVKDEASAKAAIPALEKFATRLQKIGERQVALDAKAPPTEEEQKSLKELREKEFSDVRGRLDENMHRIRGTPEAFAALHGVLTSISEASHHRGNRFSIGFIGMRPPPAIAMRGFRPPPSRAAAREQAEQRFGKEKIVTVVVHKVPAGKFKDVVDKVKRVAGSQYSSANGSGENATIVVAPVENLDEFAGSIDFGTVTGVDPVQRQVTIDADASKL